MAEWSINSEIEYLHRVITGAMTGSVVSNPIYTRLFQLSIVSLLRQIDSNLEELNKKLDVSVILEGVSIEFDKYLDENYWLDNFLFQNEADIYKAFGYKLENLNYTSMINEMTDFLPNGEDGYSITQDVIDTFKSSIHHLCDRNKIGSREIQFTLHFGLRYMLKLLGDIKQKVEHPQSHQFRKVWDEICEDYKKTSCRMPYLNWREDNVGYKMKDLKTQQKTEIYRFLNIEFFRFYEGVTGADVKNRKLKITEDDLPVGSSLSENFSVKCAKFEKFYELKDGCIICLNYEKIGQYIYRHYNQLSYDDIKNIVIFDKTLDAIHDDMATIDHKLAKHLKSYEFNQIKTIRVSCGKILDSCQKHLRTEIRKTFLTEFLAVLVYDSDIKQEVREKLSSVKHRNKYLCEIIAVLDIFRVFNVTVVKEDLARSLSPLLESTKFESILENIERFERKREGPLYEWTKKKIDELKAKPYNIFQGIL